MTRAPHASATCHTRPAEHSTSPTYDSCPTPGRRLLDSPDVELLLNVQNHKCPWCDSGQLSKECCGWRVSEEQGGVLYPMYHYCE